LIKRHNHSVEWIRGLVLLCSCWQDFK